MHTSNKTDPKLESALGLYLAGIRDGKPQAALEQYTGERYTQHSTGVGNGREGFMEFFQPFLERNPKRDIQVLRSLVDGNYVFCHVFQSLNDGESMWVTMDMFDTDLDHRIIEHWDVISEYQTETASGNDMVAGESEITDTDSTDINRIVVREFSKQVLVEGKRAKLAAYVHPDMIQHDPGVENGRDGLNSALDGGVLGQYEMIFKVLAQGNFAVTYSRVFNGGKDYAVFDLYRLKNKMIQEHWSLSEPVLPRDQWGNSGKF
ncbi:MAG: nuclear transport factor 2 family protein [Pseudomonadota bacterium]